MQITAAVRSQRWIAEKDYDQCLLVFIYTAERDALQSFPSQTTATHCRTLFTDSLALVMPSNLLFLL